MKITTAEIDEILRLLAETPRRVAAATKAMSDDQLQLKPGERSWSANDILAHLRACADVWNETIAHMLQEDEPPLKDVSPRDWLKKTDYPELPFRESFHSFVDQRRELLEVLCDLDLAGWSRGAMIGNRRHTIFSQARRMALHEVTHSEQIEALRDSL